MGSRYFGCHVSASGGIFAALERGAALGVNTIQIHPSPPQRWSAKPFAPIDLEAFHAARDKAGISKLFFHSIYLINLATPDPQKLHLGKVSLQHELDFCAAIKGDGVIFHVGSLKDEPDTDKGLTRCAEAIRWIIERAKNAPLLLEVSAGAGRVIGSRFDDLARIYEEAGQPNSVGFALDTQHMWASGYDMEEGLDPVLDRIDALVGLEKIRAIHLNDSKSALGSNIDRHENLGEGLIGEARLAAIFRNPRLATIPFILETPRMKSPEEAAVEVTKLKQWLSQ